MTTENDNSPEGAARNRRSSRSDGSALLSAHLRATRKMLSMRFDYRTTDHQVVDGIRLLDAAADEIERLHHQVNRAASTVAGTHQNPWRVLDRAYAILTEPNNDSTK